MATVQQLEANDVLELHATFRPEPLLKVLGKQGFRHAVVEEATDHVIVQFYKSREDLPIFHLDNRGLEPPQPMVRTLEFLDQETQCQNGTMGVEIWNERVPALLLPELTERAFEFQVTDEEEGTVRVKIFRNQ